MKMSSAGVSAGRGIIARPIDRTWRVASVSSSSNVPQEAQLWRGWSMSRRMSSLSSPSRYGVSRRGWHFFMVAPLTASSEPDVVVGLFELVSGAIQVAGDRAAPNARSPGDLVVAQTAIVAEQEDHPAAELEGTQGPLAGVVPEA